jgi:FlaG/FlaF family flagellin (archaellin)
VLGASLDKLRWNILKRKGRTLWYSKKGISTIIATIIIVSVSIVMAIAVAFWAMGIGNSFQKFEQVQIISIYADPPPSIPGNFTVNVVLKNTGSAAATITNIFLNGRPYDKGYTGVTQTNLVNQTLVVGAQSNNAAILLPTDTVGASGYPVWASGSSVEVQIQTAAGRSYSNTVVLP